MTNAAVTDYTLECKTLAFWNLSQIWNGVQNTEVQTGDAIEFCSTLSSVLNPIRPLRRSIGGLLKEIIDGEGRKQASETKVLPFAKPEKKKQGATA